MEGTEKLSVLRAVLETTMEEMEKLSVLRVDQCEDG
jgi:hypothetical protein